MLMLAEQELVPKMIQEGEHWGGHESDAAAPFSRTMNLAEGRYCQSVGLSHGCHCLDGDGAKPGPGPGRSDAFCTQLVSSNWQSSNA